MVGPLAPPFHSTILTALQHLRKLKSLQPSPNSFHFTTPKSPTAKCINPCSRQSLGSRPGRAMAASLPLCCPPSRHRWQGHGLQFVRHGVLVKNKFVLGPVAKLESQHSRHWRFQEGFRARCSTSSSASGDATGADIPALPTSSSASGDATGADIPARPTSSSVSGDATGADIPALPKSSNGSVNTSRWKPPNVRVVIGVAIVAIGLAGSGILLQRNRHPREASQLIADFSSSASPLQEASQFSVKWFGRRISLTEKSPGYMYFLLLMAAGFGLFVSEEALNVWVGGTLGRLLIWNQSRDAFMSSISENLPYIASTVVWVYWGVCISDMVPYYAGRQAAKSGTGNLIREKLGVSQEKFDQLRANVQRYGNLIGIVERFSLGMRNPTSFLAGFVGIKATNYFAGVCIGGLMTLPLQMGVGLVLRDRPVAALAGVAAVVGVWTLLPYMAAGIGSIVFFSKKRGRKQSS